MRTHHDHRWFYFSLAWIYRRTLARRQTVILVVGSFGKTTTTRAARDAFGVSSEFLEKNYNYSGLTAWSFLRIPARQSVAVIEVGIKYPDQMAEFVAPLKPNAVIVTCIGDEHIYSFGTREGIREEKANAVRLLSPDGIAFLNGDDPHVRWMASQTRARVVWYGFDPTNTYRGDQWSRNWPHLSALSYSTPDSSGILETEFITKESSYAALAAIAAAVEFGQPLQSATANLHGISATPGRLNRLRSPAGYWIIRDDFKSTIDTIHLAIDLVRELPGKTIMVLGGIDSPPGSFTQTYRKLAKLISEVFDEVIVVKGIWRNEFSPEFRRQLESSARIQHHELVSNLQEAVDAVNRRANTDDIVLIEGRTNEGLGRIANALMHPSRSNSASD